MIERRLIDSLYTEAMLLGDEARGYFDSGCRTEREQLDPLARVQFSCEALRITTRLMHIIAWLMTQRAVEAGEVPASIATRPAQRLGPPVESDAAAIAQLPDEARALAEGSIELFRRVARLDQSLDIEVPAISPAQQLLDRLRNAL